ncbi:MAG: alpha/beta hydrolase, partial [Nitrospinota bacterium]
ALEEPPLGLILEAPFTSMKELARRFLPFPPLASLVRTRYDTLSRIARLKAPLLIIHGERDEIVPIEQGRKLFEEAPAPKRFFAVPGAGHNDCYTLGGEPYFKEIEDFIGGIGHRRRYGS